MSDAEAHIELNRTEHQVTVIMNASVIDAQGQTIQVEKLVLDTGLTYGLMVPAEAIRAEQLDDSRRIFVSTLGGRVCLEEGRATLVLGPWQVEVSVVRNEHTTEWLLGFPVLRHLDVLLRESPTRHVARLVGSADPALGATLLYGR